jgi:DNA (cytosine-5)-methyltransferase 1
MIAGRDSCDRNSLKLLSLFAGAGGLDLGLEQAGFTTVTVNELEPHACETLRANQALPAMGREEFARWFAAQIKQKCYASISKEDVLRLRERIKMSSGKHPFLRSAEIIPGDIRNIPSSALSDAARIKPGGLTLVAGGPPCQPFSRAGKRESVDVSNGQLFREFVRVVDDLRPRWFLFENVKGLVLTKTEVVRVICKVCGTDTVVSFDERLAYFKGAIGPRKCSTCGSLGTQVQSESERGGSLDIILNEFESIGYHCTHNILNAADYGIPQLRERLIIVGSRDGERFTWPAPTHECPDAEGDQRPLFESRRPPWLTMRDVLWRNGHAEFGALDSQHALLWVKNVVRPHDEPVTWRLDRPSPTIGAHQSAKLAVAPNGVPEEQLRRQQWHTLGRRQGDHPPVSVKHAYLSDEELLTLQTFPSHWYLYGTRMQRAFQIGNAVPVRLAEVLGIALAKASGERPAGENSFLGMSGDIVAAQPA